MTAIRELVIARPTDADVLARFYRDCYLPAFPDPDERESLANIEEYLRRKEHGWYGNNNYHVIVALDRGIPVGGCIFDYFAVPNAGVIEFLLVDLRYRRSGLGRRLHEHTERLLHEDAAGAVGGPVDWIVGEMDDPYLTPGTETGIDPFERARVWQRWGYRLMDFPYVQPALSADQAPVRSLVLVANAQSPRFTATVPSATVRTLVGEYMRWAMRIPQPDSNAEFQTMAQFFTCNAAVRFVRIDHYIGDFENPLDITEVTGDTDPELDAAVDVYQRVFTDPAIALPAAGFARVFRPGGLAHRAGYRYHLWAIRGEPTGPCEGMASFLSMPSAGFGGYLGLIAPLRGSARLGELLARMERQLVVDGPDIPGWYIECDGPVERGIFLRQGFAELDVDYTQPAINALEAEHPLHLLYKPYGRSYGPPQLETAALLQAVREIYQAVYDIAEPDTAPSFTRLADPLRHRRHVTVRSDATH